MIITRMISGAKRTATAARNPISRFPSNAALSATRSGRFRVQMLKTPFPNNLPKAKAEQILLAEVKALEKSNRMRQLKERKALVQGQMKSSSANSF